MAQFESIRFISERPLLREISAARLNAIVQEIRRNKPRGERGITVRQSGDGTYIGLAANAERATSAQDSHPFKVLVKKINDAWNWGVVPQSKIFTDIALSQTVTGALSSESATATGWLPIDVTSAADYIYLEWDQDDASASIDSVGAGGLLDPEATFGEENSLLELDDSETPVAFKFARKIIAKAVAGEGEDAKPVITQGLKSHQLLQDICHSGTPARWFFDYDALSL